MTACPECRQVKAHRGHWHIYQSGCLGCSARAIARSSAAFDAIRRSQPDDLREMMTRMLPTKSYAEARAMVWKAWQIDHETNEVTP